MIVVPAAAGPSAYWYLTRGTGAVSLVLLTGSVVVGILGALRFSAAPRWPRFAIDAVHRDISLLALVLLAIHIITSVLDSFAPIKLTDAVIPFVSAYRPLWMGLGALSFDLILAVIATSLVRRRLGYRAWRGVHWLSYASWPVAVLHGLGTGSDANSWWMLGLTIVCLVAVVVAALFRIARSDPAYANLRIPAVALSVATPIGLAAFALAGPLQHGWARRAGTPVSLLAHPSGPVRVVQTAGASSVPQRFTAQLNGTVTQAQSQAGVTLSLSMQVRGGVRGQLRVRMGGAPLGGGGLSMTGSQVDLAAVGAPAVLQGQIVSLQGDQFVARVADGAGTVLNLQASLNIDSQSRNVTGTLVGTPAGSGG
jgi:methionine sulfoxide reductase heme-binding subunit